MEAAVSDPFGEAAAELAERGLAVIPCGGSDGKVPVVRGFHRWRGPPSRDAIKRMAARYPGANLGVLTGLSQLTVIDVDGGDDLVANMIERAGETPLITATPSGGRHLWYRSGGEPSANLRRHGLAVDVKGRGAAFVVAPPSRRPSSLRPYSFVSGSWDDLSRLPPPRRGLRDLGNRSRLEPRCVGVGQRNNWLFKASLKQAPACDDWDAFLDVVQTINRSLAIPLHESEVVRSAASAWQYQTTGRNWVGGEARGVLGRSELDLLMRERGGPDALAMICRIRMDHGWRSGEKAPFALSPRAMAEAGVFPSWSPARHRRARDLLITTGLLTRVHRGGRGPGDPSLYALA